MAQHAGQVPRREPGDRAPKGTGRRKGELASRGKEVTVKEVLPMEWRGVVGRIQDGRGSWPEGLWCRGGGWRNGKRLLPVTEGHQVRVGQGGCGSEMRGRQGLCCGLRGLGWTGTPGR